ncbi:MAG: cyclic nucleotide-binding domain-containing protein [bacterium]
MDSIADFVKANYMMAFWFGAFSALSLPLGALIGIWLKPPSRTVAGIMAFGGGALFAALAFELVRPAMARHGGGFVPLAIGCCIGCVVFVGLNQAMSNSGAFLRKHSTIIAHLKSKKRKMVSEMIDRLSKVDVLRALPASDVQEIVPHIEDRSFPAGTVIFKRGEYGDAIYMIEGGRVRIEMFDSEGGGKPATTTLGAGQTFGEMALLWDAPRSATVVAETDVKTWEIHKEDFIDLIETSPRLRAAVTELAEYRKKTGQLPAVSTSAEEWRREAIESVQEENYRPTVVEIKQAEAQQGGGAALAMWLGIFIDGIPESLVIGASMIGKAISPALIAGLFLANLPESMSSATIMRRQGSGTGKILWMWTSLTIMTGLGALLGNIFFQSLGASTHSIFEGAAAGAMLAMIAQTMLPEAYEHGGWLVGILTVLGFLAALFFHSLQMGGAH